MCVYIYIYLPIVESAIKDAAIENKGVGVPLLGWVRRASLRRQSLSRDPENGREPAIPMWSGSKGITGRKVKMSRSSEMPTSMMCLRK